VDNRLRAGRGAARAEDAQGTPAQSHISPSILGHEDNPRDPTVGRPQGQKGAPADVLSQREEREFFIDNLLVRVHFIIVMIRWTGLAPWEFEFPFQGSLTSTFLKKPVRISP